MPNCRDDVASASTRASASVYSSVAPPNAAHVEVNASCTTCETTPSLLTVRNILQQFRIVTDRPAGQSATVKPILTLSIRISSRTFGSRRSTSGANVPSSVFAGGMGPEKVPCSGWMVGTAAFGSSGLPSAPAMKVRKDAISRFGDACTGTVERNGPADSSEDGPDRTLLISKAVTR
jgi:hypothetical protein